MVMGVNSKMTALADEIRELSGTTATMGLDAMASNIGEANDEISSQIDLIAQITSALEEKASGGSVEQATPEISVNSTGLITATAGTKSSTYQLAFQEAKTITPTTVSQIAVSSGYYTGGNITVDAIPSSYVMPTYTKGATTYTPTTTTQTIASGTYLTGIQTIEGDSNLIASNIKSGVSIFGVSGTLEEDSGSSGSGYDEADSLIEMTMSSYTNRRVSSIGQGAFAYAESLTTASFPAVRYIDNYAFYSCSKLTTVSFPVATTISQSAFAYCTKLTTANFPAATYIGNYAFYRCSSLTTINFPKITHINAHAFACCSNLTTVNFPVVIRINQYAFSGCPNLTTASFPSLSFIANSTFASCSSLTSFYLTGSSIPTLSNVNAFYSTPMSKSTYTGSFGSIFVPASLVASYQAATNWATYADRITAIE